MNETTDQVLWVSNLYIHVHYKKKTTFPANLTSSSVSMGFTLSTSFSLNRSSKYGIYVSLQCLSFHLLFYPLTLCISNREVRERGKEEKEKRGKRERSRKQTRKRKKKECKEFWQRALFITTTTSTMTIHNHLLSPFLYI